jgi:hypothetical protein
MQVNNHQKRTDRNHKQHNHEYADDPSLIPCNQLLTQKESIQLLKRFFKLRCVYFVLFTVEMLREVEGELAA